MSTRYAIRVEALHGPSLSACFEGFTIVHTPENGTLLIGPVADQAALYGLVTRCRDLGVTLISINPLPEEATMSEGLNWIHVEKSAVIDAPVADVYAVIADYEVGHPAILPSQFKGLDVEKGGQGAGTIFRSTVEVWGNKTFMHAVVTEPEPGRLLVETDLETGQFTKFIFDPVTADKTRVTFASDFPPAPGLMGTIQRLTMPGMISDMYRVELTNLADYVAKK